MYYVGTVLEEAGLFKVLEMVCNEAGISSVLEEETELEVTRRIRDKDYIYFIINFKDQKVKLPSVFAGKTDILTGRKMEEGEMLCRYDVRAVICPRT